MFGGTYNMGYWESNNICDIILRLKKAVLRGRFILHVINIARKLIKYIGINGMSQGGTMKGVIHGDDLLYFILLDAGVWDM